MALTTVQDERDLPKYHRTIDLGIRKFKRRMDDAFPFWTKGQKAKAIALYKKKAWLDVRDTIGFTGSFPTTGVIEKDTDEKK